MECIQNFTDFCLADKIGFTLSCIAMIIVGMVLENRLNKLFSKKEKRSRENEVI